jgi:hypothetical protein
MATGLEHLRIPRALCLIEPACECVHDWRSMRTMMRLRAWISIVATVGVLLHAGFLVCHGVAMADAARQYHSILADLGSLCRTGAGEAPIPASDLPQLPLPSGTSACPVCAGLVAAFALPAPQPAASRVPTVATERPSGVDVAAPRPPLRTAHPPARGPPSHG